MAAPARRSSPSWKDVKRVATIAPDYAYGRDAVAAFVDYIKKARPDIEIVDQQWPKLGQSDFTPFITAQMAKKPDAVFCDVFGGDFVTFAKQATPARLFQGDQQPPGRRRRGRDHRCGQGAGQRLSLRDLVRRL